MNEDEYKLFINTQNEILSRSYIKCRFIDNVKVTKAKLFMSVKKYINDFLRRSFESGFSSEIDLGKVIYNVRRDGKNLKYSYLGEQKVFKENGGIKSFEYWCSGGLLVIFNNGKAVIMYYNSDRGSIYSTELNNVPTPCEYTQIASKIAEILEPLLHFDYGSVDGNKYMYMTISKHIPFYNHDFVYNRRELMVIDTIERQSKNAPHSLISRYYIHIIKTGICDALKNEIDYYDEIPGWEQAFKEALNRISLL